MPAAVERRLGRGEVMPRHSLVGDDRDLGAGPQRRDARAERRDRPRPITMS